MSERDELHEEAEERAKNEGYLEAHRVRQDFERRADAAMSGPDRDELARQAEEARRAMKDDPQFKAALARRRG